MKSKNKNLLNIFLFSMNQKSHKRTTAPFELNSATYSWWNDKKRWRQIFLCWNERRRPYLRRQCGTDEQHNTHSTKMHSEVRSALRFFRIITDGIKFLWHKRINQLLKMKRLDFEMIYSILNNRSVPAFKITKCRAMTTLCQSTKD